MLLETDLVMGNLHHGVCSSVCNMPAHGKHAELCAQQEPGLLDFKHQCRQEAVFSPETRERHGGAGAAQLWLLPARPHLKQGIELQPVLALNQQHVCIAIKGQPHTNAEAQR